MLVSLSLSQLGSVSLKKEASLARSVGSGPSCTHASHRSNDNQFYTLLGVRTGASKVFKSSEYSLDTLLGRLQTGIVVAGFSNVGLVCT